MRVNEYKKKQPVATTDTGTTEQTTQAAVTPAADEWNDTKREAGDAFKQATAKTTPTPAVATTDTATDAADADADVNKTILDGFLKQQEALNKEKEQIDKQDPNTPEAIKKTRRRALIASIADGLSALSGMYFATKGAPATNNVVPAITEGIAKQNTADRNTYLELLQNWRKQNNELINNYATYQLAAEKNRIANDNLRLSIDREARLYAKDVGERVYKEALLKYKRDQLDDLSAHRKAQIEQRKAELKARQEYWNRSLNIAQRRANNAAAGSTTTTSYTYNQGKLVDKTVTKTPNNGNKQ